MAPNSVAVTMEKPDNFSLLEINGSDPSSFPDNKRKSISPKQFSWFILLKAHRVVSSLSWLFASVKKRLAFSSKTINEEEDPKSRGKQMYRFIKACLVISIVALSIEIVAYYKNWNLDLVNRPSWEVRGLVEWSYVAWLSFRSDYIAPIVITLSKFCTVLFLIQSLDRLVLCLGCFWIKFKKIEPKLKDDELDLEDASNFPMVLIQIPMCNEREVYEQSIGAASQLDWPKDRILIQVLDDSDDPNLQLLIKEEVDAWAEKGVNIIYRHRLIRTGYKAGNLRATLSRQSTPTTPIPNPRAKNIRKALSNLVGSADSEDVLVVHYSGHGTRLPAETGEDDDTGYDECIVPCDMNLITDNDFRDLVDRVPQGSRMTIISDSCHSGGLIDEAKEQIGESHKKDEEEEEEKEEESSSRFGFRKFLRSKVESTIRENKKEEDEADEVETKEMELEDGEMILAKAKSLPLQTLSSRSRC